MERKNYSKPDMRVIELKNSVGIICGSPIRRQSVSQGSISDGIDYEENGIGYDVDDI